MIALYVYKYSFKLGAMLHKKHFPVNHSGFFSCCGIIFYYELIIISAWMCIQIPVVCHNNFLGTSTYNLISILFLKYFWCFFQMLLSSYASISLNSEIPNTCNALNNLVTGTLLLENRILAPCVYKWIRIIFPGLKGDSYFPNRKQFTDHEKYKKILHIQII